MYTAMPYPTIHVEFTPRDLELVLESLADSLSDCEQFDDPAADDYRRLVRVLTKLSKDIITH